MLKNLKLSMRLGLGFSMVLIFLVVAVIIGTMGMRNINGQLNKIINENVYKMNLYESISKEGYKINGTLRELIVMNIPADIQNSYKSLQDARDRYGKEWETVLKTSASEQGMILRQQIKENLAIARPINDKVIALALKNQDAAATEALIKESAPAMNKWLASLDEAVQMMNDANKTSEQEAAKVYSQAYFLMLLMGCLALTLGTLVAVVITRGITKPINNIVQDLNAGSDQVSAASSQLSSASQQLSSATSELASSIEETSSTLGESSSMVKQNSENTKQAALLAAQTKAAADKGNEEMREMMTSMTELKKSSDQIAKIIKVIDEIAFQTNILALNAAVEAARAGDAGMGFAVVADEVRNLAQRSAQAAKDTANIIEGNISLSERGVEVAQKVGAALADITNQAKKVNELMDEVSAASQEQTIGIMQINKAISQMEEVTQKNATNSEESAAASEQLNAQAETMKEVVLRLILLVNGSSQALELQKSNQNNIDRKVHNNRITQQGRLSSANPKLNSGSSRTANTSKLEKIRVVKPEDVIPLEDDTQDF